MGKTSDEDGDSYFVYDEEEEKIWFQMQQSVMRAFLKCLHNTVRVTSGFPALQTCIRLDVINSSTDSLDNITCAYWKTQSAHCFEPKFCSYSNL